MEEKNFNKTEQQLNKIETLKTTIEDLRKSIRNTELDLDNKSLQNSSGIMGKLGVLKEALRNNEGELLSIELGDEYNDRKMIFSSLKDECLKCKGCLELSKTRKSIVFGDGSIFSEIMIIGTQPSIYGGDISGNPLLDSKTGKFLKKEFMTEGFDYEGIYRTNILKCASPRNRVPYDSEIKNCNDFLRKEIEIVNPKVIFCLGRIASSYFISKNEFFKYVGKYIIKNNMYIIFENHPGKLFREDINDISRFRNSIKLIKQLLKGGKKHMVEKKSKTPGKSGAVKKKGKIKKYGEDVEKKILELHKQGKSPKEISEHFNGHPAVPKIKRVIKSSK